MSFPKYALICAAALSALTCPLSACLAQGGSYGMGPGMMGGGMMGPATTAPQDVEPAPSPAHTEALLNYIHEQNLACLQCHAVSKPGFGPPFALIAANYARRGDAEPVLAEHIAHGFGNMPAGFASDAQATRLAKLILELRHVESRHGAGQGTHG